MTTEEDQETIMYNKSCIYELQQTKKRCIVFQKVHSKLNDLNEFNKKIFTVIPVALNTVVHYSVKIKPKFLEAQNNIPNMLKKNS